MSEEISTSTPVTETPAPQVTPSPKTTAKEPKVKIELGSGGSFGLDEFQNAIGEEEEVDDVNEPEQEEGAGELLSKEEDSEEEKEEVEETEEEETEETEEDLDELSKETKKGIKAFTKDGKPLTLPPDLEIEQVVDGETVKINLREHLNVVAGELTVNSRLGKIASFREQVETRRKEIEEERNVWQGHLDTLANFAKEGKPEYALCYLAEMNGTSPIEMKKSFLKSVLAEAERFVGKSEVEIENFYLNLENQWRNKKEKKAHEKAESKKNADMFVQRVDSLLAKEGLSPDDFSTAAEDLREKKELEGLSRDEALSKVIEHASLVKHVTMAKSAIEAVDPKLVGNKKLFSALMDTTHPSKFTVEEMSAVVKEFLGQTANRIASSLSKKAEPKKVIAKSEKQNEAGRKKVFKSVSDLARAFNI